MNLLEVLKERPFTPASGRNLEFLLTCLLRVLGAQANNLRRSSTAGYATASENCRLLKPLTILVSPGVEPGTFSF